MICFASGEWTRQKRHVGWPLLCSRPRPSLAASHLKASSGPCGLVLLAAQTCRTARIRCEILWGSKQLRPPTSARRVGAEHGGWICSTNAVRDVLDAQRVRSKKEASVKALWVAQWPGLEGCPAHNFSFESTAKLVVPAVLCRVPGLPISCLP